jgi:hypothetical protein
VNDFGPTKQAVTDGSNLTVRSQPSHAARWILMYQQLVMVYLSLPLLAARLANRVDLSGLQTSLD